MLKKGDSSNKRARVKTEDDDNVVIGPNDPPLTMPHIQIRIRQLLDQLPDKDVTTALNVDDIPALGKNIVYFLVCNYV